MENKYLFDTNALIQLGQRQYVPDLYPDLWPHLFELISMDVIAISEFVIEEISEKLDDPESNQDSWRETLIQNVSAPIQDENYQSEYKVIANKCNDDKAYRGNCSNSTLERFLNRADVWLIAIAKKDSFVVVSNELKGSLKIPTICELEEIKCISTIDFFRSLNISFKIDLN